MSRTTRTCNGIKGVQCGGPAATVTVVVAALGLGDRSVGWAEVGGGGGEASCFYVFYVLTDDLGRGTTTLGPSNRNNGSVIFHLLL